MLRNELVDPSQRRCRHRRNQTPEGFRSRPRRLLDRIQNLTQLADVAGDDASGSEEASGGVYLGVLPSPQLAELSALARRV